MNKRSFHANGTDELDTTKRVLYACIRLDDTKWDKFVNTTQSHLVHIKYETADMTLVQRVLQLLQLQVSSRYIRRLFRCILSNGHKNEHAMLLAGQMMYTAPDDMQDDCRVQIDLVIENCLKEKLCSALSWWFILQILHRFPSLVSKALQNAILYDLDCVGCSVFRMVALDLFMTKTAPNYNDFIVRSVIDKSHAFNVYNVRLGAAYLAYKYLDEPDGFATNMQQLVHMHQQFAPHNKVTRLLISCLMQLYHHCDCTDVLHLICQLYAVYNNSTLPHHDIQLLVSIWQLDPILMICHSAFFIFRVSNCIYTDTEQIRLISKLIEESCCAIEKIQDFDTFIVVHNAFKSTICRLNMLLSMFYNIQCRTELSYAKSSDNS